MRGVKLRLLLVYVDRDDLCILRADKQRLLIAARNTRPS